MFSTHSFSHRSCAGGVDAACDNLSFTTWGFFLKIVTFVVPPFLSFPFPVFIQEKKRDVGEPQRAALPRVKVNWRGCGRSCGHGDLQPHIFLHHSLFPGLELSQQRNSGCLCCHRLCLCSVPALHTQSCCWHTQHPPAPAPPARPGDFAQRCPWEFPPHSEGLNRVSVVVLFCFPPSIDNF